ncbi:sigma-70 family RNA polymerase sigma factor [Spirillospora sp. NBC_00431]
MAAPGTTGGFRNLIRFPRNAPDKDGEQIATDLYREYHRPLTSFVMRLTAGDRQWAEDVVQETFIRAWKGADRLDSSTGSLMPWLATVARRIVIDHRRSRDIRPPEVGDAALEHLPMADQMESLLRKVVVSEALNALSAPHREVLTETVLRDRTVNQAAEVLGIPVGTVKSRVYYALRALRVALEEKGVTA